MTAGSNPVDRSKLGTKRHVLTDKEGVPLSVVMSSASNHDVKLVQMWWIVQLPKDIFHPLKQRREEKETNTYALIKHTIPNLNNKQSQNEDMHHTCHTREKEARSRKMQKRS